MTTQLPREALANMTSEQINTARLNGQLDHLLNGSTIPEITSSEQEPTEPADADKSQEPAETTQITRDDLGNMTPQQVEQARLAGELDHLLKGRN